MHTHECKFCEDDYHCTRELCLKDSLTCEDCRARVWRVLLWALIATIVVLLGISIGSHC
jgi:hypothetical protein